MKTKVSAETIARVLDGLREELLPSPPRPHLEAEVLPFPPRLNDQELSRRQMVIDAVWERNLAAKRELEAEAARSCHVGFGDPDWRLR